MCCCFSSAIIKLAVLAVVCVPAAPFSVIYRCAIHVQETVHDYYVHEADLCGSVAAALQLGLASIRSRLRFRFISVGPPAR